MLRFWEMHQLVEDARRTAAKSQLYPFAYGGIGLYADADYLTHAADSIYNLTKDSRLYDNGDKAPFDISHLPGHKQYGDKVNNGDNEPFDINHLPGNPVKPKDTTVSGEGVPYKKWTKLVTKPRMLKPDKYVSQELKPWNYKQI